MCVFKVPLLVIGGTGIRAGPDSHLSPSLLLVTAAWGWGGAAGGGHEQGARRVLMHFRGAAGS